MGTIVSPCTEGAVNTVGDFDAKIFAPLEAGDEFQDALVGKRLKAVKRKGKHMW
jgi:hypothetical protein